MDLKRKLILEEFQRRFSEFDPNWLNPFSDNKKLKDVMGHRAGSFSKWHQIRGCHKKDSAVADQKLDVLKLNKHLDRVVLDKAAFDSCVTKVQLDVVHEIWELLLILLSSVRHF